MAVLVRCSKNNLSAKTCGSKEKSISVFQVEKLVEIFLIIFLMLLSCSTEGNGEESKNDSYLFCIWFLELLELNRTYL